jgi:L-asparaginase II
MTRFELLARSRRGGFTESWHFGAVAVNDAAGQVVATAGDGALPAFLRSAAKPFQAVAMLRSGLARLEPTVEDLALICASHAGDEEHVEGVEALLRRHGQEPSALLCGAHEPLGADAAHRLRAAGRASTALHNNCSGKHAGMVLTCLEAGWSAADYGAEDHPLQVAVRAAIARFCGLEPADLEAGVDGCSVPTYRAPLHGVALAYARLADPSQCDDAEDAAWAERIYGAMTGAPRLVAGAGQFTTRLIEAGRGAILGKEGADGLYAVALRGERPLGVAVKIADGTELCRGAVVVEVLRQLGALDGEQLEALADCRVVDRLNVRGSRVGDIVAEVALEGGDAA